MKIKLYKEEIIKDIILSGKYPSVDEIRDRLYEIDPYLPIFNTSKAFPGEKLDVKKINEDCSSIFKDLSIIYEILEQVTVKEIMELESFVNVNLNSLMSDVIRYRKRAEAEINSTMLGSTILSKSDNFEIIREAGKTIIKLGEVSIKEGSAVSFFLNASNIEADKCVCVLQDTKDRFAATPYNYNQESIIIESKQEPQRYEVQIDDMSNLGTPFELKIGKVSRNNTYSVMYRKNQAKLISEDGEVSYVNIDGFFAEEDSILDFYVVGGTIAEFTFSEPPLECNFNYNERYVKNLKKNHHFKLKVKARTFIKFKAPHADIFADYQIGLVRNEKLYYTGDSNIREFYIDEYDYSNKKDFYAYVEIYNDDNKSIEIDNILIKEMFSF